MHPRRNDDRPTMQFDGEHFVRRNAPEGELACELFRRVNHEIAPAAKTHRGVCHRIEGRTKRYLWADRVGLELERRHDAKISAAATHRPEKIGVLSFAGAQVAPVGGDHVHREQIVAGEAVLAGKPTVTAAKGQAGDAGFRHDAEWHGETEGLGLVVDIADGGATACAHPPCGDVDAHRVHGPEIDDDAAVAHGIASDIVSAATHRDQQIVGASEVDGIDDIGDAAAPGNDCRTLVDAAVPDDTRVVVACVTGRKAGAAHSSGEPSDRLVAYRRLDGLRL